MALTKSSLSLSPVSIWSLSLCYNVGMNKLIITLILLLLVVVGCGGQDAAPTAAPLEPTAAAPAAEPTITRPTSTPTEIRFFCDEQPTITADQPVTFEIKADIAAQYGINTILLVLDFDRDVLDFTEAATSDIFDIQVANQLAPDATGKEYVWVAGGRAGANGPIAGEAVTLATVTFMAKQTAATSITFYNNQGADDNSTLAFGDGERFVVESVSCEGQP